MVTVGKLKNSGFQAIYYIKSNPPARAILSSDRFTDSERDFFRDESFWCISRARPGLRTDSDISIRSPQLNFPVWQYYNTNRLLRAIPGNTNPEVNTDCSLIDRGMVFLKIARASWLVLCLLTNQGYTETSYSSEQYKQY